MLGRMGDVLDGCSDVGLEFSLRLRRGALEDRGRFSVWLPRREGGLVRLGRLLERLDAPAAVRDLALAAAPVRLGLGVAVDAEGVELRCYRHDRLPGTLKDRYRVWRWRDGAAHGVIGTGTYEFHFMPETPDGREPASFLDPALRPAFASLLAEERFRLGSGFWLRRGPSGAVEQVDLAFPWHPLLGNLPGFGALARDLDLPSSALGQWRGLPVRHIAANGPAAATAYASASLHGRWPDSEAALQERVCEAALALHHGIEQEIHAKLPPVPLPRAEGIDLDAFYSGDTAVWRAVLGGALHYHAGLFTADDLDPSDAAMDEALRRAVTELFPFIPPGGRVYDIGCGWGGPLAMLAREHGCPTLGLTISRSQFRHVAALGLPVRWGDAAATLPPGRFDVALLLESFSHIEDKPHLLRLLRPFADRLVMRVNCQDAAPPGVRFGGSMRLVRSADLRAMLDAAGWRVRHWRDRRPEAIPSVMVWHRRLTALAPTADSHLETLRAWCARVAAMPREWAANNPLIEFLAD